MDRSSEVFTLLDDDGRRHEFTLVEVVEIDQRRYALLQPVGSSPEDEETAVVFRVENDMLVTIEDDAEIDRVVEALEAMESYDEITILDRGRAGQGPGA